MSTPGASAAPFGPVPGPGAAQADGYAVGTPSLDTVVDGPWTTSQGDPTEGSAYPTDLLLPTYTPGGPTTSVGGVTEPNLAVYPGVNS